MNKNDNFDQLNILVGIWEFESTANDTSVIRGKSEFKLIENGKFLHMDSSADPFLPTTPQIWKDNSPYPLSAIIGYDDFSEKFFYNYADKRGVRRVYEMSFENNIWKYWGKAKENFYQRSEARINDDGKTMKMLIERSTDKKTWETDFNSVYKKV